MDPNTPQGSCGCRTRHRTRTILLLISAALASALVVKFLYGQQPQTMLQKAPELTGIGPWINSDGLKLADQKGKVVVLHFWTFGCINCQRNLPYYNKWQEDFAKENVQIIGIHTPETSVESDPNNVATQVKKLSIKYPVAVDPDSATWKVFENHFWPSIYLIDKQGRIRYRWEGELEYQDAGGDKILRAKIKELLAEPAK